MPFGYSRDIFKYPSVQYIPLEPYQMRTGTYPGSLDSPGLVIYNYLETDALQQKLRAYKADSSYQIGNGELAILVHNARVNLVEYRGYEVILVGQVRPATYQLFKITTSYFYKDNLIFILYDGATSEKLDWERYDPNI